MLDLRGVTFMDCYSLGCIVGAHAGSATEGWTLRLLDLTGAARVLPLELPAAA